MSVQDTSLLAWASIQPILGERQMEVLNTIRLLQSANNEEISEYLHLPINCITPRVNELRRYGMVVLDEKRENKRGRIVYHWKVMVQK